MDASSATSPRKRQRRWFQFGLRTLLLATTLVGAGIGGWFGWQRHLKAVRLANEAEISEVVFRAMFVQWRPGEVAFLSIDMEGDRRIDPPDGFIERLKDLEIKLKPASQTRMPKPGELDANGNQRIVEDPESGASCYIFTAQVLQWLDDDTVIVGAEKWAGYLNSRGYRCRLEKHEGKWQITETFDDFVS